VEAANSRISLDWQNASVITTFEQYYHCHFAKLAVEIMETKWRNLPVVGPQHHHVKIHDEDLTTQQLSEMWPP